MTAIAHDRLLRDVPLAGLDPRFEEGVIGAPGGAAGQLLAVLAAREEERAPHSAAEVREAVEIALRTLGQVVLQTDAAALEALGRDLPEGLIAASDERSLWEWLQQPPVEARPALRMLLRAPAHNGCPHLAQIFAHPRAYGLRKQLAEDVFDALLDAAWAGDPRVRWVCLQGPQHPDAIARVRSTDRGPSGTTATWVPHADGTQVLVVHPDAARFVREALARAIAPGEHDLPTRSHRLAARQRAQTLDRIARKLPVVEVASADFLG